MKKIILFVATICLVVACSQSFITPTQVDADRMKSTYPEITVASLIEGKTLMENNCHKCHGLIKPENESVEEWKHVVPIMAKKAKLNKEQETKILQYILTAKSAQTAQK